MTILNEEQTMLQDQARTWVREQAPVSRFRAMRDEHSDISFEQETWGAICELGWSGILIPEQYGGSGLGYRTFGIVLEETGRGLTASPLFASALVGASALLLGANEDMKRTWLPRISAGSSVVTLAVDEGPHHAPERIALSATVSGDSVKLNGKKSLVLEGIAADALIVAARTSGDVGDKKGISLFLVETKAPGLERIKLSTADARGYADIQFNDVVISADAALTEIDGGFELLDAVLDCAKAGLAAEMMGTGSEAFDRTLDYLKNRVQFGQAIGSFQALGHRAATHFMELELARSCVEAALDAIDDNQADMSQLCSLAKCQMGECLHDMTNDMIQIHGGIGMTDEFDAGFFLKRARACETMFGNQSFHRQRYISNFGI
jgi:alkylation response protein AidB-like acyl-CoA dehydrogenase